MPLTIKTTGVEDYVTGDGRIKMLVVGGPGVGKSRMSSFWPRPIYADCEGGRGSLADRNVPYAEIKTSQDMLDFLAHLKTFESMPRDQRPYDTVVIDTIDAFQRKVTDERLQATKKASFSGFEDWGYLESKIQMLLTRLLNLDLNVLVLVHYKDKLVGKGEEAHTEVQFQLKGDVKDSILNDFDLVGRLGTYWEADGGERVERRGLTFKKTPDWPILKDRYGVMPPWVPIGLVDESDYTFVRDAFLARLESLSAGVVVGEIPTAAPELPAAGVQAPTGGPVPPQDPRTVPLHQFDKPTLLKMCREMDPPITTTVDGGPIKGNTVKAELVQAIELRRGQDAEKAKAAEQAPAPESDAEAASPEAPADAPQAETFALEDIKVPTVAEVRDAIPTQVTAETAVDATTTPVEAASPQVQAPAEPEPTPEPEPVAAPDPEPQIVEAPVDTATGEIAPTDLSGTIVDVPVTEVPSEPAGVETSAVPTETTAPASPAADGPTCDLDGCDALLSAQNPDYLKLSFIRFKKKLCNAHYLEARKA